MRDNQDNSEPGHWLEHLKTVGIVYGRDKILPLKNFRAGKGDGKVIASVRLEYLLLERELSRTGRNIDNWKSCKGWLVDGINSFCARVNELCRTFGDDIAERLRSYGKQEFASLEHLRDSRLKEAEFIIGAPAHNEFHA